ncbi:MAG: GNAT family N-acetyltransferase [Ignavibacteriales bacterium]|nr:GNAT family N-acetyltransferase [Ignavibacteriales bacterium]
MLRIRQILESEIPLLQNFPPEDWNLDLPRLFSFHFGHSYFYPSIAEVDDKIVGCGIGIIHGSISWLGTIIVLPEYRRQGIGQKTTSHLIDYCRSKGCTSQLLTASAMGEPIYRKLGFEIGSMYVFYKRESIVPTQHISHVREMRQEDFLTVKQLDREVTGEDRYQFIERFFSTGWIYTADTSAGSTGGIAGFYLPDFGGGLIIARTADAGLGLMKLRLNRGKKTAVVPEANRIAQELLSSVGFQEFRRSPRMILGSEVYWQPTMMYNRATGYCG